VLSYAQARLKNPHTAELWLAAVRVEQRAGNIKAAESLMARYGTLEVEHLLPYQLVIPPLLQYKSGLCGTKRLSNSLLYFSLVTKAAFLGSNAPYMAKIAYGAQQQRSPTMVLRPVLMCLWRTCLHGWMSSPAVPLPYGAMLSCRDFPHFLTCLLQCEGFIC